jgi:ectoine hydroxylase-related dioxygenase (phytanoyl-CoA dioxygenase family)
MQNLTSIVETYNKNGIVKVRDFFDPTEISLCKDQYNEVCKTASDEISRDEPIVVLWTHVQGASKKIAKLSELPSFDKLIKQKLIPFLSDFVANSYPSINSPRLQLLETIVFNKPPQISNTLNWHQDVSYFPLQPNNQIAIWFPLSVVTEEIGPMVYAHGSHKLGIRGSTNLHTRSPFDGEDRELIPEDPRTAGLQVVSYPCDVTDMLIHDGYTWHYSKPNISTDCQRMGVSVRFIIEAACFDPRPGQGAAFTKQIDVQKGEEIRSSCFPILWEQ